MTLGVVVIGHGGIPTDFPPEDRNRFRNLKRSAATGNDQARAEFEALEARMRAWPRTEENDRFYAGFESVTAALATRLPEARVRSAYNEFCAPTIEGAISYLIESEACTRIIVLSSMITPGGGHSESDIPEQLAPLRKRYPKVRIDYGWPYEVDDIANLFAKRIQSTLQAGGHVDVTK